MYFLGEMLSGEVEMPGRIAEGHAGPAGEGTTLAHPLRVLSAADVRLVDRLLRGLGEYGEVRLVMEAGRLARVASTRSFDVLKWTFRGAG